MFSFPFNSIYLPYSAICFGVCVFAMMVKLCIIKYKEDKNSFKVSKTTIILLIVFVVYLMLPIKREFDFAYILRMLYLTLGSVLVYIFVKFNKEFDWRKNLKILLISTLLSCCFAFFHYVSPLLKILGFGALMFNPNTLALICLAAITIFTYYAITSKLTVTETLTVGAFLLVGIVTRSRAFFVISLFNLIALFISGFKQKMQIFYICF